MGAITGALVKGAEVAIGSSASVISGAAGGAVGVIVKEALAPRGTVSEAAEQRAIREAEARKKEKSNPNLDYPSSRQVIEKSPSTAGFTGGQDKGVRYNLKYQVYGKKQNPDGTQSNELELLPGIHTSFANVGEIADIWAEKNGQRQSSIDTKDPNFTTSKGIYFRNSAGEVTSFGEGFNYGIKFISLAREDGQPDNSGDPPDFYGGQVAGALYIASCNWGAAGGNSGFSVGGSVVTGRILSIECSTKHSWSTNWRYKSLVTYENGEGNIDTYSSSYLASEAHRHLKPYKTVTPYPDANTPYPGESNPPVPDNNLYSEPQPALPVQPLSENDLIGVSAPTNKELAQKLAGLIRDGKIDDAQTTSEVRDELRKLIATDNAVTDKTKVVDNLDNNNGYSSAYSDGYADGFSALLEKDRLNNQNKANNLDATVPKPTTQTKTKQKPTAVSTTANTAIRSQVKEPTTETKYFTAGKTPVKQTTVLDKSTGVKTITQEVADTGKVVSIKRITPAGVTTTQTGVSSEPIRTNNTATFKAIGTPSNTGVGITASPQAPTIEQTPAIPEVAGLGLTAAVVAAAVYSEQGVEKLTSAAAAGTCRTTEPGGCMQNNVVNPLKAGQTSLGELFNNVANAGLAAQNAAIQAIVQNTNDIVKHSTYGLEAAHNFASQAWQSLRINKILDYLNTALILHNAALLSTNLAGSLGDIVSMIANNTINLIKNEDGSDIDINQTLGNTIEGFLTSILGAENYQNASATFHRTSRIVNSAANILNTIQFSLAGMAQGLQTVGQYTGKIGNALKSAGAVLESSYQWMSETMTVKTGRLGQVQAVIDGLEQVENIASDLENVTSEFREVQNNVTQIGAEFNKIKTEVSDKETEKATQKTTSKINSQGSQPNAADYTPDPLD